MNCKRSGDKGQLETARDRQKHRPTQRERGTEIDKQTWTKRKREGKINRREKRQKQRYHVGSVVSSRPRQREAQRDKPLLGSLRAA